jgi:hypothetical protein
MGFQRVNELRGLSLASVFMVLVSKFEGLIAVACAGDDDGVHADG